MTAQYVADEAALRGARCVCRHLVEYHGYPGCEFCGCLRRPTAALLASGVVQPREDAVREAKAEALRDLLCRAEDGPRNTGTGSAT